MLVSSGSLVLPLHVTDLLSQAKEIDINEMAKLKLGFSIRLINDDLTADAGLPTELAEHHQAMISFFWAIEEAADVRMKNSGCICTSPLPQLADHVHLARQSGKGFDKKGFAKLEDGASFYTIPVSSAPLFPQFKGAKGKAVSVIRPKNQTGRYFLIHFSLWSL